MKNASRFAANVLPVIEASRAASLRAIAKVLNACGIATAAAVSGRRCK
jgi:hypothetical protein